MLGVYRSQLLSATVAVQTAAEVAAVLADASLAEWRVAPGVRSPLAERLYSLMPILQNNGLVVWCSTTGVS